MLWLLAPMRQVVLKMEEVVEYQLKRSQDRDGRGLPKVAQLELLKGSTKLEEIKQTIRDYCEIL